MSHIFGEIRQIAFVVTDIDAAIAYWSKTLGVGPFFLKREIEFVDYLYRGKACQSPKISIALSNSGLIQIELIQQHDNKPSIYQEFLSQGREGLQHVSSWFTRKEFDTQKAMLIKQGLDIAQACTISSSGVRLAYFSTEAGPGGFIFEIADLLEPVQLERIQNISKQATQWDGKESTIVVET